MRRLCVALLLVAAACKDTDGDGARDSEDCAPLDASVGPGAEEICDGIDNNCDGYIDEDVAIVAYLDRDLDGYGDAANARRVCTLPENGSEIAGDCDDFNPLVHPDADELCDGIDNNCDGSVDTNLAELTFYVDGDGDGHGDPNQPVTGCIAPEGTVALGDDCDDADPHNFPGNDEQCDLQDNDCDTAIDEDLPEVVVWEDADGDGSGNATTFGFACGPVPGWSLDNRDCDDSDPAVGATLDEIQGNGTDEDCDGYVDEYGVPVPYATWQDALAAIPTTETDAVLQFDAGQFSVNVDTQGRELTLAGEGCGETTLLGNLVGSVVTMESGRIEGLTLTGGVATRGGGLKQTSGTLVATGLCVEDNSSDNFGGGIAVQGGEMQLVDSRITGNRTGLGGGGVYVNGGATLTTLRTQILDNTSDDSGGGISVIGGHMTAVNTVVAGNEAIEGAGGIWISNDADTDSTGTEFYRDGFVHGRFLTLADNHIPANSNHRGSAIVNLSGILLLEQSIVAKHGRKDEAINNRSGSVGTVDGGYRPNARTSLWNVAFDANGLTDLDQLWLEESLRGDSRFVGWAPERSPATWDMRLAADSPWLDGALALDADGDGLDDRCDGCVPLGSDADGDGVDDACDRCVGQDDTADADTDGVPDACDQCAGGDDTRDADRDGVPDACDVCPGFDDTEDEDGDGTPNGCDLTCDGLADADGDGVGDGCDGCDGDNGLDADADGIPDACDVCAGGDDALDGDGDGVPDACDACPGEDDAADADEDGRPDGCGLCLLVSGPLQDADGSPAALGATGGPDALSPTDVTPLVRPWSSPADAWVQDTDGDGLLDAWEQRWQTDPWRPDGTADPDGDGLDHLAEAAAGTDPFTADTDADGLTDGQESASDPLWRGDNGPTVVASRNQVWRVGEAKTLTGAVAVDPQGDPLTWSWSLVGPAGSTATFVDPTIASPTFTPDITGTYTVTAEVSNGAGFHSDTFTIEALDGVTVPDDQPTLLDALNAAASGEAVFLRAGTWNGPVDLSGSDVSVVGLAPAETVVIDGQGLGPVITVTEGTSTLSRLTLQNGSAEQGGGLFAAGADQLYLRDVRLVDNVAVEGGGAYLDDTDVLAHHLWVEGNAAQTGGGLHSKDTDLTVYNSTIAHNTATDGGGIAVTGTMARHWYENCVVQGNQANRGAAVFAGGSLLAEVHLRQTALAGNIGSSTIYATGSTVYPMGALFLDNHTAIELEAETSPWQTYGAFHEGSGQLWPLPLPSIALAHPIGTGTAQVLAWTDDGDATNDLFAPRPGSPLLDASFIDFVDRDGSPADIGPGGGIEADGWSLGATLDTDGDGMTDAWERGFGLDPLVDDAAADADGDGLTNGDEYALGTLPDRTDSDGDGVDDAAEVGAGTDPTSDRGGRPVAVVTGPNVAPPTLDVTLDGGASFDAEADPLTYQWRLVQTPAGSTVVDADLQVSGSEVTLQPDAVQGLFQLGLVVNDGTADSIEAVHSLWVGELLRVPSEHATVADAQAVASTGDAILLEAGLHDLFVEEWVNDVPLLGEGIDVTVVSGIRQGLPVFELDKNERADLRRMTVMAGNGNYGGAVDCNSGELYVESVRFEYNVSWEGGAVRMLGCTADFVDVDVVDNAASSAGGGVEVTNGSLNWTRGVVARNSAGSVGGGIAMDSNTGTLTNLVIHHNDTASAGGGIFRTAMGEVVELTHLTVAANTGTGGGLYLKDAVVRDTILQDNSAYGIYCSLIGHNVTSTGMSAFGNTSGTSWICHPESASLFETDARFGQLDPMGDGRSEDLRLSILSPLRGQATTGLNPDGSPADIGAYGGPLAPLTWDALQLDRDNDGLADVWEVANGSDPDVPDSGADADLDGLSAAGEQNLGTDPNNPDTDGDGVSDIAESLPGAQADPLDPTDKGPQAVPGPDVLGAAVGAPVAGDGSASTDPDGDAIDSYTWTLVALPGRSALTGADLVGASTASVSFTPDSPGTYTLALTVTANMGTSPPALWNVVVDGTVEIPADYATLQAAVDGVSEGHAIQVDAGTWLGTAALAGKSVTIRGAGMDNTTLDGGQMGSVIEGLNGEALVVEDLTITGGLAVYGGAIRIVGVGGQLDLTRVRLQQNSGIYGGAVRIANAVANFTHTEVLDNDAGRLGGGISALDSDLTVVQSLLAGNLSDALHGGALHQDGGSAALKNSVLADNSGARGGALHLGDDTATLEIDFCTFSGNTSRVHGDAINHTAGSLTLRNSIVDHDGPAEAVYLLDSDVSFNQTYSLITGTGAFGGAALATLPSDGDALGNRIGPPANFVDVSLDGDWSNDDWTLDPSSVAFDAADPALSDPDGTRADMGAGGGPDAWLP